MVNIKEITLVDELFAPWKEITLTYSGPEPFAVVNKIVTKMKDIFELTTTKLAEPVFKWTNMGDVRQFFVVKFFGPTLTNTPSLQLKLFS